MYTGVCAFLYIGIITMNKRLVREKARGFLLDAIQTRLEYAEYHRSKPKDISATEWKEILKHEADRIAKFLGYEL